MPATVIIGTQWGDEGKGKVVDLLAAGADVVVRFHGGNNAGHTLVVNGEKTILNLVPAGVLHPGRICMLGSGVVIDPEVLVGEIEALRKRGYLAEDRWLRISEQAHLIMPYHRAIDRARERLRGAGNIGTTGRGMLLEGAQGMMLDVDHGTYPFVPSSSCVAGAAAAGAGLPPRAIDRIVGITKAYTTRVGGGPFPTELTDALGDRLRADGDEYGATTGRPRRCGWFDAVVVRQAAALSGVDGLAVTKLDVLTGIDPLRVCTAYELGGRRLELPPATERAWARVVPQYEELPGWREPLGGARALADLPSDARRYLERLAALVGVPVALLSVGAQRDQTIRLGALF